NQRTASRFQHQDVSGSTPPVYGRLVETQQYMAAVTQSRNGLAMVEQPKGGNGRSWQRQEAIEAGVDSSFDLLIVPARAMGRQPKSSFSIGRHDSGDHGWFARRRVPRRNAAG